MPRAAPAGFTDKELAAAWPKVCCCYRPMRAKLLRLDRRGLSLVELVLVLGLVGLLTLFSLPSVARVIDQVQIGAARTTLINLYHGARMAARASNRMTVIRVSGNRIVLERNSPTSAAKDTLSITDLAAQYGALLSGPDSIRIDPRGMLESNLRTAVKYVLNRGARTDSVQLSSYGRIVR